MKMLHKFECFILADGGIDHAETLATVNECLEAACPTGAHATAEYVGCREMSDTGAKISLNRKFGVKTEKSAPRKVAKFVKPVGA